MTLLEKLAVGPLGLEATPLQLGLVGGFERYAKRVLMHPLDAKRIRVRFQLLASAIFFWLRLEEGGPPTGGPYLFGEYFGMRSIVPAPERFTLADYEFSRSMGDMTRTFVQRLDVHYRQTPDGSRPP